MHVATVRDPALTGIGTPTAQNGMTLDPASMTYVVIVVAYGLSTIPLVRGGWRSNRPRSGAEVIRFSRRRGRHEVPDRLVRAS